LNQGVNRAIDLYGRFVLKVEYDVAKNARFINKILCGLAGIFGEYSIRFSDSEVSDVKSFFALFGDLINGEIVNMMSNQYIT